MAGGGADQGAGRRTHRSAGNCAADCRCRATLGDRNAAIGIIGYRPAARLVGGELLRVFIRAR
jgi:hypothetical protein